MGWNCTNSRSASRAPAARRHAPGRRRSPRAGWWCGGRAGRARRSRAPRAGARDASRRARRRRAAPPRRRPRRPRSDQPLGERALEDLDPRRAPHAARRARAPSRRRWRRRGRAGSGAGCAPPRGRARARRASSRSNSAPSCEQPVDPLGHAVARQRSRRLRGSTSPAPAATVSAACSAGESSGAHRRRDAALRPGARAAEPRPVLVSRCTRSPAAPQPRAAVRPATPVPTTTTSARRAARRCLGRARVSARLHRPPRPTASIRSTASRARRRPRRVDLDLVLHPSAGCAGSWAA